jgi:ribosomal protein S18 acetylase RimI-like enzyme
LVRPGADDRARSLRSLAEQLRRHAPAHWAFLGSEGTRRDIAFVTLGESFSVFAGGTYGIINELWVHPECRSQGLGAQVVEHCRAFGRMRCWRRIDVSVPPTERWDRTFTFYEKAGFELKGRTLECVLKQD